MLRHLLGRIAATIPVVVLISLLVFLLIHAAPGDPADLLLSDEASAADIAEARHRWGLDQPIYVQYIRFLANIMSGDLGMSFKYADPVISLIGERLPATVELAIASEQGASIVVGPEGKAAEARIERSLQVHVRGARGREVALVGVIGPLARCRRYFGPRTAAN